MNPDTYFSAIESRQMRGTLGDLTGYAYRDIDRAEADIVLARTHQAPRHNVCVDCGALCDRRVSRCKACHCREMSRKRYPA